MRLPATIRTAPADTRHRGFTLIELMITLTVLAVVMVVLMAVLTAIQRSKVATSNQIESTQAARVAVDLMARDLRSAGFGADLYSAQPQPPIAYVDSLQVLININLQPYPDDTIPKPPLAYNPAGFPRPFPLNGTAWQPPIKYRRGAETIRWTLDVNNDGQVNANDVSDINGQDAQRTPNPNDFVLIRQIFGDSTGNIAANNGGQIERVALIRRPGGGIPPLFQVYLAGNPIPWDWSLGPVPPNRLAEIERLTVQVVAPSGRRDGRGNYAETRLRTEVNSIRNVPNFGRIEYPVDGYVFHDINQSKFQDPGEPGLSGATVRLGRYAAVTTGGGYYIFRVPAGTYTLRHKAPPGYGTLLDPDSTSVTVGPATSFSFPDTARKGGWVGVYVWDDKDYNQIQDAGEGPISNVRVNIDPSGEYDYTDGFGKASLFAPEGFYSVSAMPPDSFIATTPNPVTGSMTNGGSASAEFGLGHTAIGTVQGTVFRDNNRNGVFDSGEPGLENVWVGVTNSTGTVTLAYQYTDASGTYSLNVPANDPPQTSPHAVTAIVPAGYYATSTTTRQPIWVGPGDVVKNQDFGMLGYQVIVLNASRVLSLSSGDLIEKQGSDNGTNGARRDADIVLGADAGGTDNISVWFNQYDNTPVFDPSPVYTRNAPQSVLSLTLDTLDSNVPQRRLDAVTGTKTALAGNFFVWLNQNTGGNEGYFPTSFTQAYRTQDNGDVQAVRTLDCAGGLGPDEVDIIVGTKSPTAGQGSIEVWASNNAVTPLFARLEVYPPAGGAPPELGEVNAIELADVNGDGLQDLLVGTRKDDYSGQFLIFRNNGKGVGISRFTLAQSHAVAGIVTSIAATKVDFDGMVDAVLGVQTGSGSGDLVEFKNQTLAGIINFVYQRTVNAPGVPLALLARDFGGIDGHDDLALGWRMNTTSYVGGVRIYSLDAGRISSANSDPSAGSVTNMVPALTSSNFNFGLQPVVPLPPYLADLAAGVKVTALTGALVVFIR